jgi:hypothetical protein
MKKWMFIIIWIILNTFDLWYQSEFVVEVECEIVVVSVVGVSVHHVGPVVGPVVVVNARESGIRVGVLWVGTSDIWLRIFFNIGLEELVIEVKCEIVIISVVGVSIFIVGPLVSPVVVVDARESAVRVRVLWVGTSDIWLRIFHSFGCEEWFVFGSCPVVGPVVVVEAGESGIWMGVLWVGASDIWLRIFSVFLLSKIASEVEVGPVVGPVIVVEAAESGIWMGVLWVGTSDIWLRIFSVFLLSKIASKVEVGPVVSPVIMVEWRESGVWMSILWIGSSDVWLWVFSVFLLSKTVHVGPVVSPVIMVETAESRIWMGVLWVSTSDIWLRIFSNLSQMLSLSAESNSVRCSDQSKILHIYFKINLLIIYQN